MTEAEFSAFDSFRREFKAAVKEWSSVAPEELRALQAEAAASDTPPYPLETAVVYNRALDDVRADDQIRIIVIGDNPGKDEQLAKNNCYLVGQSGKVAEGFFRRNPELGIDFRKNALILNKTPVHTAKTKHLRYLQKSGTERIRNLILESQIWMAEKTAALHKALRAELWLVGYAELKAKGIFVPYREKLRSMYSAPNGGFCAEWDSVFAYQHFSMNCFLNDKNKFAAQNPQIRALKEQLSALGKSHRDEIFGA